MNEWIDNFYFLVGGAALLLSVLGLWFIAILPGIDRWSKNFFMSFFIVLMLCCIFGLIGMYYPVSNRITVFILFLSGTLLSLAMPMVTAYLLHCCGESLRRRKLFRSVSGLWVVSFVLIAISPFTDAFFYITEDNQFYRTDRYWVLLLPLTAIMLCNLLGSIRRRKILSFKTFLGLSLFPSDQEEKMDYPFRLCW